MEDHLGRHGIEGNKRHGFALAPMVEEASYGYREFGGTVSSSLPTTRARLARHRRILCESLPRVPRDGQRVP